MGNRICGSARTIELLGYGMHHLLLRAKIRVNEVDVGVLAEKHWVISRRLKFNGI